MAREIKLSLEEFYVVFFFQIALANLSAQLLNCGKHFFENLIFCFVVAGR